MCKCDQCNEKEKVLNDVDVVMMLLSGKNEYVKTEGSDGIAIDLKDDELMFCFKKDGGFRYIVNYRD